MEMKDSRTNETFSAIPIMSLSLHHIPTKSEVVKNADGYWCLDGWKLFHILRTPQDIHYKQEISMSLCQPVKE